MRNLYLIGMMGCGKSTCGRLLSLRLGLPLLDTDRVLEEEAGMTVNEIFAERGETAFRDMETALCRRLAGTSGQIVSCGGGLPLREENRRALRESGTVVLLLRNPAEILATADMSARPLGRQGDFLERYESRLPLYQAAAHIVIRDFSSPETTAEAVLRAMREERLL